VILCLRNRFVWSTTVERVTLSDGAELRVGADVSHQCRLQQRRAYHKHLIGALNTFIAVATVVF
jgi:hypothetical protein